MEMEVRGLLAAINAVVLERKYSEWAIRRDNCFRDFPGRYQYGSAFLVREVEQRRDVPTCNDTALTHLELPRVDYGERVFGLVDDLPRFLASRHAKVARISYGKFDHLLSPNQLIESMWSPMGSEINRWINGCQSL